MAKTLMDYFDKYSQLTDQYLDKCLIPAVANPGELHEAIRYAVFPAGKRIRPILTIACAQAVGGKIQDALLAACAAECLHAYSLVHDDLPCMDDDDIRRGKPSVHKKYGEATAVLVGDALLTQAFELISRVKSAEKSVRLASVFSRAAGSLGMVGGQMVDKLYEGKTLNLEVMDYINIHKTGKLLAASCQAGAIAGGATAQQERIALRYGEHLGFVFQLIDDIIDADGYVRLSGKAECLRRAESLTNEAIKLALKLPHQQKILSDIARFLFTRKK